MSNYSAQAVSRDELRQLAFLIRKAFGYEDVWWIPVEKLLDQMCEKFEDLSYEIVEDSKWDDKKSHADTDILNKTIRIKESVYINACEGNGRDRMTIAHEMAHYILICVAGVKLYSRNSNSKIDACKDPEWQAKCLAGELLIPYYKIQKCKVRLTAEKIEKLCGVSNDAAKYQLKY